MAQRACSIRAPSIGGRSTRRTTTSCPSARPSRSGRSGRRSTRPAASTTTLPRRISGARTSRSRTCSRNSASHGGARRYRPFFDFWSLWSAFSPVPYNAVNASADVRATSRLTLHGRGELYRYQQSGANTALVPELENSGWRASGGGTAVLNPQWTVDANLGFEHGPGAAARFADAALRWSPNAKYTFDVHGGALDRPLELRYYDASSLWIGARGERQFGSDWRLWGEVQIVGDQRDRPDAAEYVVVAVPSPHRPERIVRLERRSAAVAPSAPDTAMNAPSRIGAVLAIGVLGAAALGVAAWGREAPSCTRAAQREPGDASSGRPVRARAACPPVPAVLDVPRRRHAAGASRLPEPHACASCHDGVIQPRVTWQPRTAGLPTRNLRFTHEAHARAVTARNPADSALLRNCAACHNERGAPRMEVKRDVVNECIACHGFTSPHVDVPSQACATCHVPVTAAATLTREDIASFPKPRSHEAPDFALGGHGKVAKGTATSGPMAVSAACATCHAQNFCITCHVNAPESPVIARTGDGRALASVYRDAAGAAESSSSDLPSLARQGGAARCPRRAPRATRGRAA